MIQMEKSGVPVVALGSKTFERDFHSSARVHGMPEVPFITMAERALVTMNSDEINHRVESMGLDILVDSLTNSVQPGEEAYTGEITSLATVLFGQEVPEVEVFEGTDRLDAWDAMNTTLLERQWGDGFPLIAPTREAVAQMLTGTGRPPDEVVAVLEPCFGLATVEKIAINAVMAGCKPEHLPILIAAVDAISDPRWELRHAATSTAPYTPMLVVNGPITRRIGMNSGMCCLGPGAPSAVNTVIGRAMRLVLMNLAGNYAGVTDVDTIGDPNKYSMCLAEGEEDNPWEPLHVERGFGKDESTVTAFVAYMAVTHADHDNNEPIPFLRGLASSIRLPGASPVHKWLGRPQKSINTQDLKPADYEQDCLIILGPNHARMLARAGWSKVGVKEVIHDFAKFRIGDGVGMISGDINKYDTGESARVRPEWAWLHDYPDKEVPAYRNPDCYQIIVAGADSQKSMVVISAKKSITRRIEDH